MTPDELLHLIGAGESGRVEFKSSFQWDYREERVNKALRKPIAKSVAALLNSQGGHLLVGVSDKQTVLGIGPDLGTLREPDVDLFERTVRQAVAAFLGPQVGPSITTNFIEVGDETILCMSCEAHPVPTFLKEGDKHEFFVRDGNRSAQLDVRSTHEYIRVRWPSESGDIAPITPAETTVADLSVDDLKALLAESASGEPSSAPVTGDRVPPWVTVGTRRVLNLFLHPLARAKKWDSVFVISPWISDFGVGASMSFAQFLQRLKTDRTVAYVVTRRPVDDWHRRAVERLAETGRANIVFVPSLHVKLFYADTPNGAFALVGSANFTQKSLTNRELGLLVEPFGYGKRITRQLRHEAYDIYRTPERTLEHRARFAV